MSMQKLSVKYFPCSFVSYITTEIEEIARKNISVVEVEIDLEDYEPEFQFRHNDKIFNFWKMDRNSIFELVLVGNQGTVSKAEKRTSNAV